MAIPVQKRRYSIEEYLEQELTALDRHEFHDGEILAMSGGSIEQRLIAANILREIGNALKGKPCRAADSNLCVRIPGKSRYMYPDALVFCGPPQFDPQDDKRHTIINPRVIIEILAPSAEAYDRGDKFTQYRQIPSFEEYILISQDRPNVESYHRQPDGTWPAVNFTDLAETAKIRSLGIEFPMTEVYAGIEWP